MKVIKVLVFLLIVVAGTNAQAQVHKGTKAIDTEKFATVKIYDKSNNVIEEMILMDQMSHEEAMNQVDDMVEGIKSAKSYKIVSPKNFTLVTVYNKRGKVIKEMIFKDYLSVEDTKDMVENLDVMSDQKAKYFTINDSETKY